MNDRETILRIIGALGGDPLFWVNAPTCRDAMDKAEVILREYRAGEVSRLQAIVNGFADRIAAAHEVIAKRAEKDRPHVLWYPIDTAPRDGTVFLSWSPGREGLPALYSLCSWHPDGGFCVDEVREPTHWMPFPEPPEGDEHHGISA